MDKLGHSYKNAEEWKSDALFRKVEITEQESLQRQKTANAHNHLHAVTDPDLLQDQQLYILGKMEIEEYQDYLLFKHSNPG